MIDDVAKEYPHSELRECGSTRTRRSAVIIGILERAGLR
jgi:hypothetical protein